MIICYKVLQKIKEIIGIEKIGDTKILIETGKTLSDDIAFWNVVIRIIRVLKDRSIEIILQKYLWKRHYDCTKNQVFH